MEQASLVVRILLAGVFLLSSLSKLLDRSSFQRSLVDFKVPRRLVKPLAYILPVIEAFAACALLIASTAVAGAVVLIGLLLVFTVVVTWNLYKGRTPNCGCFGVLSSDPISKKTLVRNAVLLGGATLVATASPSPSILNGIQAATGLDSVSIIVFSVGFVWLVGLTFLALQLLSQYGLLLNREGVLNAPHMPEAGIEIGNSAPEFEVEDAAGKPIALQTLLGRGQRLLFVFISTNCGPCEQILPQLSEWQRELQSAGVRLAIVSGGERDAILNKIQRYGLNNVLLDTQGSLLQSYQMMATPSAVVVGRDGKIASKTVLGESPIRDLVQSLQLHPTSQATELAAAD